MQGNYSSSSNGVRLISGRPGDHGRQELSFCLISFLDGDYFSLTRYVLDFVCECLLNYYSFCQMDDYGKKPAEIGVKFVLSRSIFLAVTLPAV